MSDSNELDQCQLLRVRDVALVLAVSQRHVWSLISNGELKVVRLGKKVTRVRMSDLQAFVSGKLEES